MIARINPAVAKRALAAFVLIAILVGGYLSNIAGGSSPEESVSARLGGASSACARTVLAALRAVGHHVYDSGVSGERPEIAIRRVLRSQALREAVERGDAAGARSAALALLASGRMTNLTVRHGARTLADVGQADALAPLRGSIPSAGGAPLASFEVSVWSRQGFLSAIKSFLDGEVALRVGTRTLQGSFPLPAGELPPAGTLTVGRRPYQYDSFDATLYPTGSVRVYVIKTHSSTKRICGHTAEESLVNTLSRLASRVYAGESGAARTEVRRAQQNSALLEAVAARDPAASRRAVAGLVYDHHHIVRLRVSAGGQLLGDVGGPYVLAPVSAPLSLHGRQIGELVLSIQDDEGYLRLAKRLVGLDVLMYMSSAHPELVKNSLGPNPGIVPASGLYHYRGKSFRVFTINARSFPSGQLRIAVLVPIPYS